MHTQYQTLYQQQNLSKTQFLESKARLEKAQASYEEARAQWQHKKILAPFSGVMGIPHIYPGLYITPGQKDLIRIVQLHHLWIDFDIPEKFYPHLQIGQKISLENQLHARIIAIEPLSQQLAHTIHVRARLEHDKGHFVPGQFIKIKVPVSPTQTLISLPTKAILASPSGLQVFTAVFDAKQKSYRAVAKNIDVFQNFKTNTLISKGLSPNDWVLDAGTQKITDGQAIHLRRA